MNPAELSYVRGGANGPLIEETIGEWLDRVGVQHAEQPALISCHQGIRYSYSALRLEVDRVAAALVAIGVNRGDRVGIWAGSRAEWVLTQLGVARIGAVLVTINPAYRGSEVEYALRQSGVSVLVLATGHLDVGYVGMLRETLPRLGLDADWRAATDRLPALRTVVSLGGQTAPGLMSWRDLLARAAAVPSAALQERLARGQSTDAASILYTSGTTGTPKGATLSHRTLLNTGRFVGDRLRYTTADRVCVPVPLYHVFGCVLGNLAALTHGSTIVLPSETFDPVACLKTIQEERCTAVYGVPTMFAAQLRHSSFDKFRVDSLRTGLVAGAPCPVSLMREIVGRFHVPEITISYGMTETPPAFQSSPEDPIEDRVATVGSVLPHVEAKIISEDGETVPRGTAGELCTRGFGVMLGYWNDGPSTGAVRDDDGWLHTGDLAVMRGDGYVRVAGRLKDMILRGGENLYPREIEEVLQTCPAVQNVQVVGVPDRDYGEEVCAWIQLKEGHDTTDRDIRKFCRQRLATSKIPRYVRFTADFPMTVTGKIQKFRMREISILELGLDTQAGDPRRMAREPAGLS